jgi:prephenate dehydrogenase
MVGLPLKSGERKIEGEKMDNEIFITRTDDALKNISKVKELLDEAFEAIKVGDEDTCLELLEKTTVILTSFDNFLDEFSAHVMQLMLTAEAIKQDSVSIQ